MMSSAYKSVTWQLLLASILLSTTSVKAHSGAHPVRYVSQKGVDDGVCNNPKAPCRTIEYAVNQSGKGDKIHVAEGEYSVQGLDIFYLLSDMVEVTGGYGTDFKAKNIDKTISTIKGVPFEYRQKLADRGFRLIQDSKEQDIQLSLEDKQLLEQYKKITSKVQGPATCVNGKADDYDCNNFDLQSHIPLGEFSTNPSSANDIWGFVDRNNQREYALIGLQNATAIVDVTDPQAPLEVGSISGMGSTWRDIKIYQYFDDRSSSYRAYAYVTTEASQGLQIIDLNSLPDSVSLVSTLTEFNSAHNVYLANVNYADGTALEGVTPYLTIEGANRNSGAFRMFSLTSPESPSLIASPPSGAGYVHDATSLVITDARTSDCRNGANPCELFIDFNERTVDIWDMSSKSSPLMLSSTGYANSGYTHSGWWSDDKKTIFIQDELDERNFGMRTTLRALDISDLKNPTIAGIYTGPTSAIDHNGFTLGNEYYMSNYTRGLTVIDVSDPTNMTEIGFFDTYSVPSANNATFNGAWGTFPYLPSGNILISDIEYGLFVVKKQASGGGDTGGGTGGGNTGGAGGDPDPEEPASSSGSGGLGGLGVIGLLCFASLSRRFSRNK